MFTGLVQDVGEIIKAERKGGDAFFTIRTGIDLSIEKIGASICCSGCCLTVLEKGPDWFSVEVSAESLSKTTIGEWEQGTKINIEPSLRVGSELGGHFLFGHVDGLAEIVSITPEGESHRLIIKPPYDLMRFIASKGSVGLDGISLTVNEVNGDHFGVNIISHTWERTTLHARKAGDFIHFEADMLARYVARQLEWQSV
ncbi:MAG: riboflavin synthase [Alphaproteobacteria bacterium]|nr:riboflavin synthase [Alphaproteobacteria bacterium]MCD8571288.1 riboflavin synthase [Alphaproteobacteria bacterium]